MHETPGQCMLQPAAKHNGKTRLERTVKAMPASAEASHSVAHLVRRHGLFLHLGRDRDNHDLKIRLWYSGIAVVVPPHLQPSVAPPAWAVEYSRGSHRHTGFDLSPMGWVESRFQVLVQ